MSAIINSIHQDNIPDVNKNSSVIIHFTLDNNNEPDLAGAHIQATAPEHTKIVSMMCYSPSVLTIAEDGKTAKVTSGTSPDPWHTNRTITLAIDSDAPLNTKLTGLLQYYSADNKPGPDCPLSINVISHEAPIITESDLLGSWQDWQSQGWIYSYRITLKASSVPIKKWAIYFDRLPSGTTIFNRSTLWTKIISDGTAGVVQLETPDDGSYIIQPDTKLSIDIQILYPASAGKSESFNTLYDLVGVSLD